MSLLSQNDIDGIAQFYHSVIQSRDNNIEDTLKYSMDKFSECYSTVMLKIVTLSRELDLTGFLLEEEIKKLTDDKTAYIYPEAVSDTNIDAKAAVYTTTSMPEIILEAFCP